MILSIQEISDRFEIQDLCYRYAQLIDAKQFDELREVFTEDAHIDYSVFGGAVGGLEDIIQFLKDAMGIFPYTQHLNANIQITVNGDTAEGRVMCFNPQEMDLGEGSDNITFILGLWYVDKYHRTKDGWRIKQRVEEKSWKFNTPDFMGLD